jgi:hypothetical protein
LLILAVPTPDPVKMQKFLGFIPVGPGVEDIIKRDFYAIDENVVAFGEPVQRGL